MMTRSSLPRGIGELLALALTAGATSMSSAQPQSPLRPGQTPGPRFVMSALKGEGDGPALGFQVANALRQRIASDFDMHALWVVPESLITKYLMDGGYRPDQPLSMTEARQLATSFRAEELLNGVVTKTPAGGFRVQASWSLGAREDMVQPLPAVEGTKISDVAKLVAREFQAARKQVESVQRCMSLARARNYAGALAEARKAIDAYPKSVLGRVCIANIYDQEKLGPDSMIRISEEILAIHPENARALAFAADGYGAKGMVDDQIRVLEALVRVDPTNRGALMALARVYAGRGQIERAMPLVDSLVAHEGYEREAVALQLQLHSAARDWTRAVEIGESILDADSAASTRDLFIRLIAAAEAAGNDRKALDFATRGVGRFPMDDELAVLRAQYLRRTGQLAQARAVLSTVVDRNPRSPNAWMQKARVEAELGLGADTVLATLGRWLERGGDRGGVTSYARSLGQTAAKDTMPNKLDPLRTAVRYLKFADATQATDTVSLVLGQTDVILAQRLAEEATATKSCGLAKEMSAVVVDAQVELPKAGRKFPDAVAKLLTAAGRLATYGDQLSKSVCRKN
jgi:tetratricopeptide (TPR) repeat protein